MMKKFLLLLSVMAIVFTSCYEIIPPQPTGIEDYNYVFKKKNGKVLTGVEKTLAYGDKKSIIPIEYDRITTGFNNTFFLACKGDGAKVINQDGKTELDGMSIKPESIKYMGEHIYMAPGDGYSFENTAGQKYWWFTNRYLFTGYDDLIPCCNGFVFRKHNKYGFAQFHAGIETRYAWRGVFEKDTVYFEYKVIIPEKYDALYEITNNLSPNHFFLAKEENKWVVLNSQGQITKRYPPQINKNLVNLPIKDKIDYDFISGNVKDGHVRLGKNNAGLIAIAVPRMTWSSYCR